MRILILGAGVGRQVLANDLRRSLSTEHRVTVVERNLRHAFALSFLWVMTGDRRPEQVTRDLRDLLHPGVEVVEGDIRAIDLANRRVQLDRDAIAYDYLVVALGAELAPEAIPGLAGAAHTFYTLDGATRLRAALDAMAGGTMAVVVSGLPYKCPGAPHEAAMLIADFFRRRGRGDKVSVRLFTPEPQPMPVAGPALGDAVRQMLEQRSAGRRTSSKYAKIVIIGTVTASGGRMSLRPVKRLIKAKPTLEGAGVHLRRAFGFGDTSEFDPFLLLDDFRNEKPEDYLAGFPWHPHRGIETITYVLAGTVEHGDSIGNRGAITAGDIQWMTAGSGIVHQEMPKGDADGRMHGFQLWANLPAALKMTPPRYQEVKAPDIPEVTGDDGTRVRIVCGSFWGKKGPVDGIAADPVYIDVSVPPGRRTSLPVETARHAFAYVFAGAGRFCNASDPLAVPTEGVGWADTSLPTEAENRSLVLFDRGDEVTVQAGEEGVRFLLVSGRPLREPVAWYGPIVMNTQEELRRAYEELQRGTFLKHR